MTNILEHVISTCDRLVSKARITKGYGKYDIDALRVISNSLAYEVQSNLPNLPEVSEITHRDLFLYSNIIANTFELIHSTGKPDDVILTFFEEIVIIDISKNHTGHFEELRESFKSVYSTLMNSDFKKPLVTLSYKYNQLIGSYIDNRDNIICINSQQKILTYELLKFGINVSDVFYRKTLA